MKWKIQHKQLGVYVGDFLGFAIWSRGTLDAKHHEFSNQREAEKFLATWEDRSGCKVVV